MRILALDDEIGLFGPEPKGQFNHLEESLGKCVLAVGDAQNLVARGGHEKPPYASEFISSVR
ncbi:MAG: hypothetical protein AAF098_10930 [Pseudomonadota bacterium]